MTRNTVKQFAATIIAVGIYLAAGQPWAGEYANDIVGIAGLLIGWVWLKAPGHGKGKP